MIDLTIEDFKKLDCCPWCSDKNLNAEFLYTDRMDCDIVSCRNCGIVFAQKRLSEDGLKKYWDDYLTRVHLQDNDLVKKRNEMYKLDFDFIHQYKAEGKVLDIGCGNGAFLDLFDRHGYQTFGVEFGREAAETARNTHVLYFGEFPKLKFSTKYDLIIFRGTLQYLPRPKEYLDKAVSLLNDKGCIFITAQPNMDSFCFQLFKENFTQPVNGVDFIGYTKNILKQYFKCNEMSKVGEKYFYEETPYAEIESDILKVAKAIEMKQKNMAIDFKAPAFWGNMMSLVFAKCGE